MSERLNEDIAGRFDNHLPPIEEILDVARSPHCSRTGSGKQTRASQECRRRRQLFNVITGHEACLTTCCVVDPKSSRSSA
jgi:hypothetical protein